MQVPTHAPAATTTGIIGMSHFFIKRPIFAWVIAILIMLGGVLAILGLPIAQYPQIAPTVVTITATYPGANAQTAENSVTKVIEQNMTGVDYLQYMSSYSTSTGIRADLADLHQRGQSRYRPGAGAEQAAARDAAVAAGGAAAGHQRGEVVVELPDGARLRLRGRQLTASDIADYVASPRSTNRSAAFPASARYSCSAPNMRCGSGSIRTSSRNTI
jgi:hypothetical protein